MMHRTVGFVLVLAAVMGRPRAAQTTAPGLWAKSRYRREEGTADGVIVLVTPSVRFQATSERMQRADRRKPWVIFGIAVTGVGRERDGRSRSTAGAAQWVATGRARKAASIFRAHAVLQQR